ncbi:MAG: TrkH family potassium uptake protein [bacterium]|nr:TrkH family potassium uptake protein [bacterium]
MFSNEDQTRSRLLKPARKLVTGFLAAIATGTFLLWLPWATADGFGLALPDAIFTATSAVCVTGLVVVETGSTLSGFGQGVVLALIQAGGLGIMTVSTMFAVVVGKRIGLGERLAMQEAIGVFSPAGIVRLTRMVVLATLAIEAVGAVLLTGLFARDFPLPQAAWYGVFHSVSAFCNAGFSPLPSSLQPYAGDVPVNLVFVTLIFLGGIGFYVLADIWRNARRLSLHSRMALYVSGALIALGALVVLLLEGGNADTLGALAPAERVLASIFQAVTPRTAGFNTLPTGALRDTTLLFLILLMLIGASPGSTGGGIKTTTFWVLLATARAILDGRSEITVFERRLSRVVTDKALVILVLALGVVFATALVLTVTEQAPFLQVLFEATSAFGTVGLSTGITPQLSLLGRLLLPLTMFVGRLGPVTVAMAIAHRQKAATVRYPEDRVIVG